MEDSRPSQIGSRCRMTTRVSGFGAFLSYERAFFGRALISNLIHDITLMDCRVMTMDGVIKGNRLVLEALAPRFARNLLRRGPLYYARFYSSHHYLVQRMFDFLHGDTISIHYHEWSSFLLMACQLGVNLMTGVNIIFSALTRDLYQGREKYIDNLYDGMESLLEECFPGHNPVLKRYKLEDDESQPEF